MQTRTATTLFWIGFALAAPMARGDDRFGVMTHFAQGWDPAWIPIAARTGIPLVRDELYWAEVEPRRGEFIFPAAYDRYMDALAQHQISPLIVLSFGNPNYDGGDTPHSNEAVAAYARYATEVLRHYGPKIKAVEIWNEFNGSFARGPATQDRVDAYLRLLRAAHTAIKRERPDVIVAAGATSGLPLPYWEKLLAGGVLDFSDVLSVHPYRYESAPEGLENELIAFQAVVQKFNRGKNKPVWVTELGWYTRGGVAPGDPTIDDDTQAKFLVRAFVLLLSAGVDRAYWYLLHDIPSLSMGLFRDDQNRSPRPAAVAMSTLIRQLQDARFVRREESAADFYSFVFARPGGAEMRVMWSLSPLSVIANGVTAGVDWRGNPIPVGHEIAVDDAPLFLVGPPGGLPPPAIIGATLTNSIRDFSSTQGDNGWVYGAFLRGTSEFTPLRDFVSTDWNKAWVGGFPALTMTAGDQHPSVDGSTPIAIVRRWQSNYDGRARVIGTFRCGTSGDGVGVTITVDGKSRLQKLIGGGNGRSTVEAFDFVTIVHIGSTLDFAVDPGPAAQIDYDATAVTITITKEVP